MWFRRHVRPDERDPRDPVGSPGSTRRRYRTGAGRLHDRPTHHHGREGVTRLLLSLSGRRLAYAEPDRHVPCGPAEFAQIDVPRSGRHRTPFLTDGAGDSPRVRVALVRRRSRPGMRRCCNQERRGSRRELRGGPNACPIRRIDPIQQDDASGLGHSERCRLAARAKVDGRGMTRYCEFRRCLAGRVRCR